MPDLIEDETLKSAYFLAEQLESSMFLDAGIAALLAVIVYRLTNIEKELRSLEKKVFRLALVKVKGNNSVNIQNGSEEIVSILADT